MLECVVNVSEGRRQDLLDELVSAVRDDLLDIHSDPHHNRSVFTLVGESAPRRLTAAASRLLDLSAHDGVHPRLGVVDVVPFVPLGDSSLNDAIRARNTFAEWASDTLAIPTFFYEPERTLPFVRKHAFRDLVPDVGPTEPHPKVGALCVGARNVLVAYNLFVDGVSLEEARAIAVSIRSESVRALAFIVGDEVQVSMNLVRPHVSTPFDVYQRVSAHTSVIRAELVGLIPSDVLAAIPRGMWDMLDLGIEKTIESRVAKWATRQRSDSDK